MPLNGVCGFQRVPFLAGIFQTGRNLNMLQTEGGERERAGWQSAKLSKHCMAVVDT